MKFLRFPALLLACAAVWTGCEKEPSVSPTPPVFEIDPRGHLLHAQPKLPTIQVIVDGHRLEAEIARRQIEIATGMMFRTNMPENTAMIFVFDDVNHRSFYMRNCEVPLSAAYIAPSGEIFQIIDMKPHDETGIPSQSDNIQFVLEVPQGWFTRHNVGVGAVVRTEKGSLQDTFFGNSSPAAQ
ncbi:MAG TPA: DUF192 domain-containing protein [Candidatus Paceibacterota bacterium]|nr:DUF192 domain-containing protein [Candidatus Paceibacterota bacterium]